MKAASLLLLAIFLAAFTNSFAETPTEALRKLEAAVEQEEASDQAPNGDSHENHRRSGKGRAMLARVSTYITRNDLSDQRLEQALHEVLVVFNSDAVHKAADALAAVVKKETESTKNAELAEINGALKQARDAVANAHKTQELDEPLKTLGRFFDRQRTYTTPKEVQEALGLVRPASVFLQRWQNYLAAKESGNTTQAREVLQNISSLDSPSLIPRSQILAELQKYPEQKAKKSEPTPTPQVDELVGKAKTLDDVHAVIEQLRDLRNRAVEGQRSYDNSEPLVATLNALVRIEQTYREFQAGLPVKIEGLSMQYPADASSPGVIPLKAQLMLLTLPRHLGLAADKAPKPNETVQAFLERTRADAGVRGDRELLSRIDRLQSQLSGDRYGAERSADEAAWEQFHAAQKQEAAGQFLPAVVSYERVLKTGSDAIPAKLIGEKLAALQTAHPQEYEAGVRQFLNVGEDR